MSSSLRRKQRYGICCSRAAEIVDPKLLIRSQVGWNIDAVHWFHAVNSEFRTAEMGMVRGSGELTEGWELGQDLEAQLTSLASCLVRSDSLKCKR